MSTIERSEMLTSDISRRLWSVVSSVVVSVRPVARLSAGKKKLLRVLENGKLMVLVVFFTRVASLGEPDCAIF